NWPANMASVIDRRPKGVVTLPLSIFFTFDKAKEGSSPKTVPRTLDCDSWKCDSRSCYNREGFHDGNVRGPFSFAFILLFLFPIPERFEVVQTHRTAADPCL
ncbi:hypothetical protein, partial [Sinorhizobium medicae]|uniref:hypothetical protein n=1 Tax=Sinorhizobium medicae TaxID=110321 RepID=UPI001AECAC32